MTFTSIISFLNYCGIEINDQEPLNLARIKKQVNAEFSMTEGGFISIDNINYNKQDVLRILDAPNVNEIVSYHKIIDQNPALKSFLINGTIVESSNNQLNQEVESLIEDEGFIQFVSPYYAPQYNKEMRKHLQLFNFESAANWLPNCRLVWSTEGEIAFQSTTNFLNDNIRLFKNLNSTSFRQRKSEVLPWTGHWARFINWLPDLMFALKEDFCIRLIDFCVEIQNEDRPTCYLISKQMVQLNFLDQTNTSLIHGNHEVYESNVMDTGLVPSSIKHKYKRNGTSKSGTRYLGVIIVAILIIIRLLSTCNKEKYTDDGNTVIIPTETNDIVLKSLISKSQSASPYNVNSKCDNPTDQIKDICYISFMLSDTSEKSTFQINNKTNQTYYAYISDSNSSLYYLDIEPKTTISINRDGNNVDLMLVSDDAAKNDLLKQRNYDRYYWTKKGNFNFKY